MLSNFWMNVGNKLPCEELQIKFHFRHGWPTSNELLPFVPNWFSGLFLAIFTHIWMKVGRDLPYEELQIKFHFRQGWPTFLMIYCHFVKKTFSRLFFLWLEACEELHIKFETSYQRNLRTHWMKGAILTVIYWKVHRNNGCWFDFVGVGGGPVLL